MGTITLVLLVLTPYVTVDSEWVACIMLGYITHLTQCSWIIVFFSWVLILTWRTGNYEGNIPFMKILYPLQWNIQKQ